MRVLTAAMVLAVLSASWPTQAHFGPPDNIDMSWDEWAARQWSKKGGHCCSYTHARLFKGRYEFDSEGNVTVYFDDGQITHVPADRMVNVMPGDLNPTGSAVIWMDDPSMPYCFSTPGPLA